MTTSPPGGSSSTLRRRRHLLRPSGGPFLGDSDLLVATTISGDDDACKATNYDYRLDAGPARDFLARYVKLP